MVLRGLDASVDIWFCNPSSVAAEAVRYFDRIYHEEGLLANMTAEERYKERLVKINPLLDELFARLETV